MTLVRRRLAALSFVLCGLPATAAAAKFTVTSTADSGKGSLRQALLDANALPGADTIAFKMTGVRTITPLSPLPPITEAVTIDAYAGTKDHLVVLTGSSAGPGAIGLDVRGTGSVINYLVVNYFSGCGIRLGGGGGHTLTNNFIGTDADGTTEVGNYEGVVVASPGNRIGVGGRNVISGNAYNGVRIASGNGNQVQGNYVGPNRQGRNFAASGTTVQSFGIQVWSWNNTINLNLVAGQQMGITLSVGNSNVIVANTIGATPDGAAPLGSLAIGIMSELGSSANVIGSPAPGGANTIAHLAASQAAILLRDGTANTVRGNRIYGLPAGVIPIDLLPSAGVTPNDPQDLDTGANRLQNFPLVTDAVSDGVSTLVFGELRSAPSADYLVDVYTGPEDPASGSCETRAHIGAVSVHTDATGRGTFFLSSSTVVPWGEVVSATATSAPGGDTSELSPCTSVHPPS